MTRARTKKKGPAEPGDTDDGGPNEEALSGEPSKPPDRQTVRKARRFLQDVEKLKKRHAHRLSEKDREKLETAVEGVRAAIDGTGDKKRLSTALKELDSRVDQVLGFAKKSTTREYAESIVIAILIAVVLRAFVVEAFKIPTGSMIPTLEVGDHIFVNKFIYGLRVPFTNQWFVEWGSPIRGDVIVFRYPRDLSKDYIKRVVAVAGDRVRVEGHDVFVNEQRLERSDPSVYDYVEEGESESFFDDSPISIRKAMAYPEVSLGNRHSYTVIYEDQSMRPPFPAHSMPMPGLECRRDEPQDGHCTVQEGFVFVMGDNRDNSSDSRVWGGVPITYVKGKAMFIWWSRGPRTGVRWGRMGSAVH